MPTAFVTGGTGFLGLNLIKELTARDWDVIAFHRSTSNLEELRRFEPELKEGDLTSRDSVAAAMPEGVDAVFHVAAMVSYWKPNNAAQERTNVDGARAVAQAALERGAKRFIHTSSVAAWGMPDPGQVIREDSPSNAADHWMSYLRTKYLGQEAVLSLVEEGLPAVVMNPVNIVGPYDFHNWSRSFRLLKEDKIPGIPSGGGAWCHVKDVVDAHITAVDDGRVGECYLLGGPHASYAEAFGVVAELIDKAPPKPVPPLVLRAIGRVNEWVSYLTRKEPDVTPEIAVLLNADWDVDSSKAKRELGYGESSLREMFEDCHAWMKQRDMI